jgi:hypothetical protein
MYSKSTALLMLELQSHNGVSASDAADYEGAISALNTLELAQQLPCQECHNPDTTDPLWNKFWKFCPWCGRKL